METKVLEKQEINSIIEIKQYFQEITNLLGQLEVQKLDLELRKEDLKNELINLKDKEREILKNLETKYGKGKISLDTGEFIPDPS